jgi:maleylacetate reductase
MTDILGETAGGRKTTRRDPAIRPQTVIYDVALTLGLPPRLTATSGLNALAHAVEALYAPHRNPILTLMAGEAVRALGGALPALASDPGDRAARTQALYGAWLCGAALGGTTMGLHHKLCHVLGGSFGLPHAETHAVVLPHAAAYNGAVAGELLAPVGAALGGGPPGAALHRLAKRIGAPLSLRELGLARDDVDRAAEIATDAPYQNPRPVEREAIRRLLEAAWEGAPPDG